MIDGAVALAAGHQLGAALDGLLDPGLHALGFAQADERAHLGGFIGRVAGRPAWPRVSTTFHRKVWKMLRSTKTRCTLMQDWPA